MNKQRCAVLRRDGRYVLVLKNASVLKNERGKVIGAVESMVGRSAAIQRVYDLIDNTADSDAPLAIYGESGTGKELVARAVHERGKRSDRPCIKVNCAALNEALLESELFGHVRCAFTGAHQGRAGRFEAANGGSLFLDEIGDLPMLTQVKLLRVLEEKVIERVGDNQPVPVDVRIITATNRNLEAMVREGSFRQDLFYRINVIPVRIPPLRERIEDVPLLAESFFRTLQLKSGKDIRTISRQAIDLLMACAWPGNVRELRSSFEYAFVTCQTTSILPEDLPSILCRTLPAMGEQGKTTTRRPSENREEPKKQELVAALQEAGGNQSRAAEILDISRVTVWTRIKRYGLKEMRWVEE